MWELVSPDDSSMLFCVAADLNVEIGDGPRYRRLDDRIGRQVGHYSAACTLI